MPPIILIPLAYAGLRTAVSSTIRHKVSQGIDESASIAVRQISRSLLVSLAEISINILIFLLIIYKTGDYFAYQTTLMMICSVYIGSMMHSVYKVINNFDLFLTIARDYRLNVKRFIFEQVYANARSQAQERLNRMGVLRRLVYKISSGPGADTVALRVANGAMPLIWKRVSARMLAVLITVIFYILIFRLIVAPFLIQETTHFSPFQAFLWPFAFSVDFFFHTHLSGLVVSLM